MIRGIFGYYIVDLFVEISFFIFVHTMFEEVISIILRHRGKFLTYQTDMLLVPVRFADAIQ